MVAAPSSLNNAELSPTSSGAAPSRVCRLRGLPYSATEDEIHVFFKDYTLEEVYTCRRDGRATGEAYVMFSDAAQAGSAMETCNKKYLGSRYIEMFEAAEADLAAVKKVLEDAQLQGCVVRLRGLPYTATAEDVAAFFQGVKFVDGPDAVVFTITVDGRPTGECYVELADRDAQNLAMTRHKELMGTRYIEIFHSNKMDKQAQQQRLCMPPHMPHRWGPQAAHRGMPPDRGAGPGNMQPAVFAAAAAAGNKLACGIDNLAGSLQGTHISNNSVGRLVSGMQPQPQPMYQQGYPQRQVLVQPHIVTISATATGAPIDSNSSNISTGNSLPSLSSGGFAAAASAAPGPMIPVSPAAVNGAQYQGPAPAAVVMTQPGGVMHPAAVRMTPYGAVPNSSMYAGGPMGAVEGHVQQVPQQVYYMPVQQGAVPPPYGVPTPVYSMSPGPTAVEAPHMMQAGPPRPVLVGGGQWMNAPTHWQQHGWPAAGMGSSPSGMMPAGNGGTMQ